MSQQEAHGAQTGMNGNDKKPESSVENEIDKIIIHIKAGQLPADPHDMKQPEPDPPESD
jgi:hypothetical protein